MLGKEKLLKKFLSSDAVQRAAVEHVAKVRIMLEDEILQTDCSAEDGDLIVEGFMTKYNEIYTNIGNIDLAKKDDKKDGKD